MGAAGVRRHAVLGEIVVGMDPSEEAPPWFAPAMLAVLQPLIHAESRGIARIMNSDVCQNNEMVQPLVNNQGVVPDTFPPGLTLGMLKALPLATVNALLVAYDQVAVGNAAACRRQLGVWFGLKAGLFYCGLLTQHHICLHFILFAGYSPFKGLY